MSHDPNKQASNLVNVRHVDKSFGALSVLKDVSLDVPTGATVALVGRSGSGKSTLLRCINALEKINEGDIDVCGYSIKSADKATLKQLRRDVGIVFQSYNLFPHLTVLRNITIALTVVQRRPAREANEIAMEVLRKVGLVEKCDAYPEQLSGGQAQRVAIARSLALSPKLMLFDEVTSALDPELTGEVLKVIADLARGGMTLVLVTHEMAFAREVADTVVFMHQGRIWESGPPREIFNNPQTAEFKQFISSGL